jgi:hypothetical protein
MNGKVLQIERKESEIDLLYEGKLLIRIKDLSLADRQLAEICGRGWTLLPVEG